MEEVTRVKAISTFFGMTAKQAIAEIPPLKESDPDGYEWTARECARELGVSLKASK
jgi:hypothetical protein